MFTTPRKCDKVLDGEAGSPLQLHFDKADGVGLVDEKRGRLIGGECKG